MKNNDFLGNDLNHFYNGSINYDGVREFCLSENLDVGFTRLEIAKAVSTFFKKK